MIFTPTWNRPSFVSVGGRRQVFFWKFFGRFSRRWRGGVCQRRNGRQSDRSEVSAPCGPSASDLRTLEKASDWRAGCVRLPASQSYGRKARLRSGRAEFAQIVVAYATSICTWRGRALGTSRTEKAFLFS